MKAVLGWLGRTGVLYVALCAALAFYLLAWPQIRAELGDGALRDDAMSVETMRAELAADAVRTRAALQARAARFEDTSATMLQRRLVAVEDAQRAVAAKLQDSGGWFDNVRPSRIMATKRLELRAASLDAEARILTQAIALARAREGQALYARRPTQASIEAAARTCDLWTRRLAAFEAQNPIVRELDAALRGERDRLQTGKTRECGKQQRWSAQRTSALAAAEALAEAQTRYAQAQGDMAKGLPDPTEGLADNTMRDVLVGAAWALLGILLLPYVIRTLLYYLVAPIAERRGAIRIAAASPTPLPHAGKPSTASHAITLDGGEELFVRQGFLQSTPGHAEMRTRFLLDWRRPLTSLASGMALLTRVRGAGTKTVISADADPFAEVTALDLPAGASMVLQPRALAAIVQPIDRTLRIESRWRVFSLNAWLTQQLRFLVFYGPARLVLKGGRGVRIEPVDEGRRFGQDQLVGFSADLAYRVTRTETFVPYLLGREPLLRDRVEGGQGLLVLEEAPRAGRRKGARGALEGLFDAGLKAFGI